MLISISASVSFASPQLKLGLGWAPTIEIFDSTGGSPVFAESGTFFDEFSPELSLLWDFGPVSLGARACYFWSREIFPANQPTNISGVILGGEFIYNYVMDENGNWLFPIAASGGWQKNSISYRPETSRFDFFGEGWGIGLYFGVERVWQQRYSLGFLIGRKFSRADIDGGEYGIAPKIDSDGWRFVLISRFTP